MRGKNVKMPMCDYGAGCTRKGCIYRHPPKTKKKKKKKNSSDGNSNVDRVSTSMGGADAKVCIYYMSGECSFGSGCRFRHPPRERPPPPSNASIAGKESSDRCVPVVERDPSHDRKSTAISAVLRDMSLTESEKHERVRLIQSGSRLASFTLSGSPTTAAERGRLKVTSAEWTPASLVSTSAAFVPSSVAAATKSVDLARSSATVIVPDIVKSLLPTELLERIRIVCAAIVARPHIAFPEGALDIDSVIAILIPLDEVTSFLGAPPLSTQRHQGILSYATVLWSVRRCLEASAQALRSSCPDSGSVRSLLGALESVPPIATDPPLARVDAPAFDGDGSAVGEARASASFGLAAQLRLRGLQCSFDHVPEAVVAASLDQHRGNIEATAKSLIEAFGPPEKKTRAQEPLTAPKKKTVMRVATARSSNDAEQHIAVPWVDAGYSVGSAYSVGGLRRMAADEAKERNKLFSLATEAYRRGNGALAKSLSEKGRSHDRKMRKLHAEASQKILAERQKHLGTDAAARGTLDLHGQHIAEAIQMVETFLDHHRRLGAHGSVTLIAGAGKHTIVPGHRRGRSLRESLRGWLQRTQARGSFSELKGDARGTFVVRL